MAMPDILFYTGLLFYLTARSSPIDGVGAERGNSSRPTSDLNLLRGFYEKENVRDCAGGINGFWICTKSLLNSDKVGGSWTHTHAHAHLLASEATGMRRGNALWYLDCFVIISHTWFVKIKAILNHSVKVCFLMFRNPDRHSKTPKKKKKCKRRPK